MRRSRLDWTIQALVPVLFLLGVLCLETVRPRAARADGGYFPPEQLTAKPPGIPSQTAVIQFKDGMETLIVESTASTSGPGQYAWVLPLPNPPEKIDKVSPGVIRTLEFCINAKVLSPSGVSKGIAILALIFSLLITVIIVTFEKKVREVCYQWMLVIGIQVFLSLIAVADFGQSKAFSEATVLRRETVGNYDAAVLEAKNTKELDDWLKTNGFQTLGSAEPIVDKYIGAGWVFLTAKLKQTGTGILSPHPLSVTFPSTSPIYPMRLTALGNTTVDLTLFVLADHEYDHPFLETLLSDSIQSGPLDVKLNNQNISIYNYPELAKICQGSQWLTRLHGQIRPGLMYDDLTLKAFPKPIPYRKTYYTPRAALAQSVVLIIWILTVAFPIVGMFFKYNQKQGIIAVWILVGVCLAAGGYCYLNLSKIDRYTSMGMFNTVEHQDRYQKERLAQTIYNAAPGDDTQKKAKVRELFEKKYANFYTGQPIRMEHSPGNFEFGTTHDKKPSIRFYNADCYGSDQELPWEK